MNDESRPYPYGYCGMPCALCSRFRTQGSSRCPGCSCDGYYTDVCKVHHCSRERGLEHCAMCPDYLCPRLGKMGDFSDLNTNNVKRRTGDAIAAEGFEVWYNEYSRRADMLTRALENYNDGRMKRWLCELFIQMDAEFLGELMDRAEGLTGTQKEKGRAFRGLAESLKAEREAK